MSAAGAAAVVLALTASAPAQEIKLTLADQIWRHVADRFHQFGAQEERQALVAADVLMGAGIFVAGMADQHRSRHQFTELAAAAQAKTALADIGDRVAAVLFRERPVAGSRTTAELGYRDESSNDRLQRSLIGD